MFRWDYDYIEIGDDPSEKGYALASPEGTLEEADEWTVGSSSSISSGSRSPIDENVSWEGEALASHSDTEAQR